MAGTYLLFPLAHIINLSISNDIVPDEMKTACVIPLYKSGDRELIVNYRPVSILPSFSKFFERVIYNRLHFIMLINMKFFVIANMGFENSIRQL